ncbi:MAG: hypothetical protein ACTSV5_11185 [Promethearchaeota archaeon]
MSRIIDKILLEKAENDYQGYKISEITFLILTIATIIRSLIHFLSPDGGAESIATIDLNIEGGEVKNIKLNLAKLISFNIIFPKYYKINHL